MYVGFFFLCRCISVNVFVCESMCVCIYENGRKIRQFCFYIYVYVFIFHYVNNVLYSQLMPCAKWTYNVHNDRT